MKKPEITTLIEQHRITKEDNDVRPFNTFMEKLLRSEKLIKEISKKISNHNCFQEALGQFVTSSITAFEYYFKDLFLTIFKLCDENFILEQSKGLIKNKLEINEIIDLHRHNISIQEYIMTQLNFQNLDVINCVFSKLTNKSFFQEIKTKTFESKSGGSQFRVDEEFYSKISEYLKIRHNFVHEYSSSLNLDYLKIRDLEEVLIIFITACDHYLHSELIEPHLKQIFKGE